MSYNHCFGSMSENPRLTITIVSWNTCELTRQCLQSLMTKNIREIAEVHLVDNASGDESVEMVRREFPDVKVFANTENLGFARANNQSWRESKGDYWLLLNSDTIVKDGAIEKLVAFMDAHPQAGLATAKLLNTDGTPQFCAQKEPGIMTSLLEFTRLHKLIPAKKRGDLLLGTYFTYDHAQQLDWTWGTALIARRRAVEEAGALSEDYFMYGEDVEWSLRVRRHGWEIWFCPEAEIIHLGGQSSQKAWDNQEKQAIIMDNFYRALEEHRGKKSVRRLRTVSLLTTFIDALVAKISNDQEANTTYRFIVDYHRKRLFGRAN
jgi:GT2 family glycosyltransferase